MRHSHFRRLPILLLVLAALASTAAFAKPIFTTRLVSYIDVNGDGRISCGEPVTIGAFYQTDSPSAQGLVDPTELHGIITMPDIGTNGLAFLSGTVAVDHTFTAGCTAIIQHGNTTHDLAATVEVSCSQDPISLPGGATLAMTYQAVVTPSTIPQFTDVATFFFDTLMPGPGDHLTATDTTPVNTTCSAPPPLVTIAKSSLSPPNPGSVHVYTLTVNNQTSLPLGGFFTREVVPQNTTFNAANSTPGWFCTNAGASGADCSYLFSALPPGESVVTFAVSVAPTIPAGVSTLNNTACVSEAATVYDCDSISDPFLSPPTVAVTKSILTGTPASPGGVVGFDVAVTNTGNRGSSDVLVTDTLPPGTTFSASGSFPSWTCSGSTCTAHLVPLNAGETRHLSIAITLPNTLPAGGASFVNAACASPVEGGSPVCGTVTFAANGTPVLNLTKTLSQGDGTPGQDLVFSLSLRNDGDQDASNVVIHETVPSFTTAHLSASDPCWSCAGTACTCSVGALAAGAQTAALFAVTIVNPIPAGLTQIANTACPTAPTSVTACGSIVVTPRGRVVLDVTKTIAPPPASHGKIQSKALAAG